MSTHGASASTKATKSSKTTKPTESTKSDEDAKEINQKEKLEGLPKPYTDLFNNKDYSDVNVHCGDKSWYCHQAILFSKCPLLKDLMKTDGANRKITLPNDCVAGAEQMLTYIYKGVLPDFSSTIKEEDPELKRDEMWVQSSQAYLNGVKYQLESLKQAGLETVLAHASKLCKNWDNCPADMRGRRIDMISQVWTDWGSPEVYELVQIRFKILKGLVKYAGLIMNSPFLHDLMKRNEHFMLDYMWRLSYEVSEMRLKGSESTKVK